MSEVDIAAQPKDAQSGEGLDRRTLFIRSIPFEATSEELLEFFSQYAPVKHAVIVTDENKKSRGFGFVSFTSDDDTLTALVDSKKDKFKNRLLRVDIAKRRDRKDKTTETRETRETRDAAPIEKRRARLIIRNLPWSCKKPDELKKIFSRFGAVFDAYIPKKKGGQMCGFAFVTMKKSAAAEKAVKELVGLKIDGREVAVDLAVEKSKWEAIKQDEEEEEDDDMEEDDDDENEDANEDNGDSDNESSAEEDKEFHDLNDINSVENVNEEEEEKEELESEDDKPSWPKKNKQEAYSIFVRNIPYDADEDTLKEHFERFGPVKYALPVVDKETGLAKGSAFVAFYKVDSFTKCLEGAPSVASTSLLIADDVSPDYVYQGRILSITSSVDRKSATELQERNSRNRMEVLGKAPGDKDKRNLFLMNEGRITENSKLAQFISKTDLELREKSYKLRTQQLNKNPTLHLSLTRLAIRNLPRAMNSKALKALGRKAIVQFATEVKEEKRQPLSKEEINRSVKLKHELGEFETQENLKKKTKHTGVIKQAKVINEVKGSGEIGRSRGYGFLECRDHKAALMALRWLNAHEVTIPEIVEGLDEEEKKMAELEGLSKRRLIVEFAVENAQVVKRRREKTFQLRNNGKNPEDDKKRKRTDDQDDEGDNNAKSRKTDKKARKGSGKKGNMNKGNMNKGPKPLSESKNDSAKNDKSGLSDDVKKIIGIKRKRRKGKK